MTLPTWIGLPLAGGLGLLVGGVLGIWLERRNWMRMLAGYCLLTRGHERQAWAVPQQPRPRRRLHRAPPNHPEPPA